MTALTACKNESKKPESPIFLLNVFTIDSKSWGYTISVNRKIMIKQTEIPALSGRKPFRTKADAEKTGLFVLKKLENNELPICTIRNLDSLGIGCE
jgi:hypothetical protein